MNLSLPDNNFKKIIPHFLEGNINSYIYCRLCCLSMDYSMIINNVKFIDNIYKLYKLFKNDQSNEFLLENLVFSIKYINIMIKNGYSKNINFKNIINIILDLIIKTKDTANQLSNYELVKEVKNLINNLTGLILIILQDNIELCNTYLIRSIPNTLLNILDTDNGDIIKNIFRILSNTNKIYFEAYLGSIIDENSINKLKLFMNKDFMDMIRKKYTIFKRLCEKDTNLEFTDNITSTFIIIPAVINNGEQKMYCDKYAMLSYVEKTPENPYNREPLTPADLENTDGIDAYEKRRREFVIMNKY
jgi:hypothetical protein